MSRTYKAIGVMLLLAVALAVLAGCAVPTPQVIEKPVTVVVEREVQVEKEVLRTVVVEKEVQVEKEVVRTVVVEKEVPVEKRVVQTVMVRQTVIVEKEVVVAPTMVPAKFKEAPELAARVAAGELPPVDERLPENPFVVEPLDGIGRYGGDLNMLVAKASDTKLVHVYGGSRLVSWDSSLAKLVPDMCEKYEVNQGKEYIFYLRKGLKWSDGTPFTTDDFRFWWEDYANDPDISPNGPPAWIKIGDALPEVTFIDAYTVRFAWPVPKKDFLPGLAGSSGWEPWLPKHFFMQFHPKYANQEAIDKMVKDEGFESWAALISSKERHYYNDIPDYPTLQPWVQTVLPPQEKYTFKRNPYFYKVDVEGNQLPYLNNLVFISTDLDLLALKASTGDADVQGRDLAFSDVTLLKENEANGDYQLRLWGTDNATIMGFMPQYCSVDPVMTELYADMRFRQALSLGIDRQEINDVLFLGYGVVQQVELLPGAPGYNEEWAKAFTEFDPDEANRLLDDMGLTGRDSDGYRLRPDGQTLDIVFEDAGENAAYPDMLELIGATYKELGIKTLVKTTERGAWRDRMQSGDAQMGMWNEELGLDYQGGVGYIVELASNYNGKNCWGLWWETDGAEGTAPPEGYQKMQAAAEAWVLEADPDKATELENTIRKINAEEMYMWGTVGGLPAPVVVKNHMRNIPVEGFHAWSRGGYFYWSRPYQWWKEE